MNQKIFFRTYLSTVNREKPNFTPNKTQPLDGIFVIIKHIQINQYFPIIINYKKKSKITKSWNCMFRTNVPTAQSTRKPEAFAVCPPNFNSSLSPYPTASSPIGCIYPFQFLRIQFFLIAPSPSGLGRECYKSWSVIDIIR